MGLSGDAEQVEQVVERTRQIAAVHGLDAVLEEAGTRRSLQPLEGGCYRRKPAASAQADLMEPLEGWNVFNVVRDAVCPTLLVQGGQAPNLSRLPADLRELTEALLAGVRNELEALRKNGRPGLRVAHVREVGHMLHLQAPKEVGNLVRDFLLS